MSSLDSYDITQDRRGVKRAYDPRPPAPKDDDAAAAAATAAVGPHKLARANKGELSAFEARTRRYPLVIDPQGNGYVRGVEVNPSDKDSHDAIRRMDDADLYEATCCSNIVPAGWCVEHDKWIVNCCDEGYDDEDDGEGKDAPWWSSKAARDGKVPVNWSVRGHLKFEEGRAMRPLLEVAHPSGSKLVALRGTVDGDPVAYEVLRPELAGRLSESLTKTIPTTGVPRGFAFGDGAVRLNTVLIADPFADSADPLWACRRAGLEPTNLVARTILGKAPTSCTDFLWHEVRCLCPFDGINSESSEERIRDALDVYLAARTTQ